MDFTLSSYVSAVEPEKTSLELLENSEDPKPKTETKSERSFDSYFLSNLASKVVFDMMANGADKDSFDQNRLIAHSRGMKIDKVKTVFGLTLKFLTAACKAEDSLRIECARAIWVDKSLSLMEEFDKVIRDTYKADVSTEDFAKREDFKKKVNQWCQEKTGGLIDYIFTRTDRVYFGANTKLIIAAALDFQGKWFEPFEDAGVRKFTSLEGKALPLPFMTGKGKHQVEQFKGYKLLSVPFKQHKASSFSMLFCLPDEGQDAQALQKFIEKVEDKIFEVQFPKKQVQVGNFLIPKFKLNIGGFQPLFKDDEKTKSFDFMQMASPSQEDKSYIGLYSDRARLRGFLEINEKGVRAAGVTAGSIDKKLPPAPRIMHRERYAIDKLQPEDFVADRPFLFFIRENRFGRILFSGALVNHVG